MEPLDITIDTREQTPWHFEPHQANVRIGTLRTGDYALTGDTGFAIERKSLDDFLGTVSSGWERFQREIYRAKEAGFPSLPIIIEASLLQCLFHETEEGKIVGPDHEHPKLTPAFVTKRIAQLSLKGCSVVFAENAMYASALAYAVLRERAVYLEGTE